jgi:hypothetical protein
MACSDDATHRNEAQPLPLYWIRRTGRLRVLQSFGLTWLLQGHYPLLTCDGERWVRADSITDGFKAKKDDGRTLKIKGRATRDLI